MKQNKLAESLLLKSLYGLIAFAIGIYLILRAVFIPLVHDEAATFFHYIHSFDFVPFIAHWDANNHILNSALASFFSGCLGRKNGCFVCLTYWHSHFTPGIFLN